MKTRLLPEHQGLEETSHHPSWGAISLIRSETAEHRAWGTESEEKVLGTLQEECAYKGTLTTPEEDALDGHAYWPHSVSAYVYWGAHVCNARELLGFSSFTKCVPQSARCGSKSLYLSFRWSLQHYMWLLSP